MRYNFNYYAQKGNVMRFTSLSRVLGICAFSELQNFARVTLKTRLSLKLASFQKFGYYTLFSPLSLAIFHPISILGGIAIVSIYRVRAFLLIEQNTQHCLLSAIFAIWFCTVSTHASLVALLLSLLKSNFRVVRISSFPIVVSFKCTAATSSQ